MVAKIVETAEVRHSEVSVDPVTLDLIESGLVNAREQMDAILFRTAMSPIIREQRDGFPVITDREGRLHAGQFGSPVAGFLELYEGTVEEGDVFITSDPYACNGAISHCNDWLICMPVFFEGRVVNWSAMFGHQTDIGGKTPASMPVDSTDYYQEGIIIPPIKIISGGELQKDLLKLILHNCRLPEWNGADFNAIVAACRTGNNRCIEMIERFGEDTYLTALDMLLERNYRSMRKLILDTVPEDKVHFEDYICDDALGMGPYKIACDLWREGDKMIFDFAGTDPQSQGCVNFLLSDQMFKMFCAQFMINMFDPDILLNDGFFPLLEVRIPDGSLLRPIKPAAVNGRTHALGRIFDIISGLFGTSNPDFLCAAGFSSSPHFMFSGYDQNNRWFLLMQIGFGGVPAKPLGDGSDGHSLWPKFRNIPNEYIEAYYPIRVDRFETIADSGGAGFYRGGNAVRTDYVFLRPGVVSVHDDRWLTYPWGVKGGAPGARSKKVLMRASGERIVLPSKADNIKVNVDDKLIFETWGGGGWGDPLERDLDAVQYDLDCGLVSREGALRYGVVTNDEQEIDLAATESLRGEIRQSRGELQLFDFGGEVGELIETCQEQTEQTPPRPPEFAQQALAQRA